MSPIKENNKHLPQKKGKAYNKQWNLSKLKALPEKWNKGSGFLRHRPAVEAWIFRGIFFVYITSRHCKQKHFSCCTIKIKLRPEVTKTQRMILNKMSVAKSGTTSPQISLNSSGKLLALFYKFVLCLFITKFPSIILLFKLHYVEVAC